MPRIRRRKLRTTMKKLILASLLLFTILFAAGSACAVSLYFPHVATTNSWQTEIAIINTSGLTVTGNLRGLSNGGQLKETKDVTLSARGRRQITVADEFTNHLDIGYIIFDADSAAIQGYTKFYQEGKYRAAIPAVKEVNTSDIYIPHIASNADWWTGISLVNTTSALKNLTITFNNGASWSIPLNPNEHWIGDIAKEFFNNQPRPDIESAVISNASGVIGLELFGSLGWGSQLEGILLTGTTASTIYYPHVASNNEWWTGIVAYNPSDLECTITITPYDAQGTFLPFSSSAIPPVAGKGKYIGAVAGLGLPAQTAWFKIDSTRPLSGFELFGTANGEQLAAYAGGGGTGVKAGVFPKIEKYGWTGIAFVNTEAGAASVTLTAYNDNGGVVATQVLPDLPGHAKVVNNPESIFSQNISSSTYIAFSSDRYVVGFQLNGSSDGTMLDGLPALVVGGDGTSHPGPLITVHPQSMSAIVGGVATFHVTATGSEPLTYQWQKNDVNIAGATSSNYTTPSLVLGDNGSRYRVLVYDAYGSQNTSTEATLNVTVPVSQVRGTNLVGMEMSYSDFSQVDGPVAGTNYPVYDTRLIDYYVSKHVSVLRILFTWEGMQSSLFGPIPAANSGNYKTYFDNYKRIVDYATSKGIIVVAEPWQANPGGGVGGAMYRGVLVGSPGVPATAFADFWSKMAMQFAGNQLVSFGLVNEPNNMSTMSWWASAQTAITAIRATGSNQWIYVPGNGWTAASSWTSNWYDTAAPQRSNAYGWLNANGVGSPISDPLNKTAVEVHTYLDSGEGGGTTEITSLTAARDHLSVTVDEASARGYKVLLGEIGFYAGAIANDASPAPAVWANFISYLEANPDVLIGYTWWAAGSPGWWDDAAANGGGHFSITPTNGTTFMGDTVNMQMIQANF
jgi:hypothetical protein